MLFPSKPIARNIINCTCTCHDLQEDGWPETGVKTHACCPGAFGTGPDKIKTRDTAGDRGRPSRSPSRRVEAVRA